VAVTEGQEWKTQGEALVRRELEIESGRPGAPGIPHYATGQHYARPLDLDDANMEGAELSFVNVLGFVVLVPMVKVRSRDEWEPAGIQRASGTMHLLAPMRVPGDFKLTAKMKQALTEMEARDNAD
jgi:hypothetical protein